MKTIKQIADELGVSKQAVRKKITPEIGNQFAVTNGNTVYISEQGEALIKSTFAKSNGNQVTGNKSVTNGNQVTTLIDMLQRELDAKNKLIDEQQQTINRLTDTLAAAQQTTQAEQLLHADTKRIPLLSDGSAEPIGRWERLRRAWKGE